MISELVIVPTISAIKPFLSVDWMNCESEATTYASMKNVKYVGNFQPPYPEGKTKKGGIAAKSTIIKGIASKKIPPRLLQILASLKFYPLFLADT